MASPLLTKEKFPCDDRRQQFKLNTERCCFICLSDCELGLEESAVSLSVLLRYLQISFTYDFSTSMEQSLLESLKKANKLLRKADFVVETCGRCKGTLKKISELVQLLELTTMEVNYRLENVRNWIVEGDGRQNRMEEFEHRMDTDMSTRFYLKPIKNLREKFASKCAKINLTSKPRVRIKKISEDNILFCIARLQVKKEPGEKAAMEELDSTFIDKVENISDCDSNSSGTSTGLDEKIYGNQQEFKLDPDPEDEETLFTETEAVLNPSTYLDVESSLEPNPSKNSVSHSLSPVTRTSARKRTTVKPSYNCDICHKSLSRQWSLKAHMAKVHSRKVPSPATKCAANKSPKTCPLCKAEFSNSRSLIQHRFDVHRPKLFKCSQCSAVFRQSRNVKAHIKAVHQGVRFECTFPGCGKKCTLKVNLKLHVNREHSNMSESSKDDDCGDVATPQQPQQSKCTRDQQMDTPVEPNVTSDQQLSSSSTSNTRPYFRTTLTEERSGNCDLCQKSFRSRWDLKLHNAQVHNRFATKTTNKCADINFANTCSLCEMTFGSKQSLALHHVEIHAAEKFKCSSCDAVFLRKHGLISHFNNTHLGIRFECKFPGCGKKYNHKGSLKQHAGEFHPNWTPDCDEDEAISQQSENVNSRIDDVQCDENDEKECPVLKEEMDAQMKEN